MTPVCGGGCCEGEVFTDAGLGLLLFHLQLADAEAALAEIQDRHKDIQALEKSLLVCRCFFSWEAASLVSLRILLLLCSVPRLPP